MQVLVQDYSCLSMLMNVQILAHFFSVLIFAAAASWFSWCLCDCIHWWYFDLLVYIIWTLKTCVNDTQTIMRSWLAMWHQEMQVSCNKNHISKSDYLSWWYQDEFNKDWSNCWLRKLIKCSQCMSISQICEFLLIIYIILLENCMISNESDKEDHEVSMKYHMWICVQ